MTKSKPIRRPQRPVLAPLAGVVFPVWSVRLFGVVALTIAIATPLLAGAYGWVHYAQPELQQATGAKQSNDLRPRLVWLPGGTFMMGSPDGVGASDEHPIHEVTLTRFGICETEVTVRQYELVTGKRPSNCDFGCEEQHPVQSVSWEDSARYLNALTKLENRTRSENPLTECYDEHTWTWDRECTGYRLPTEAEWEYAARAGSTTEFHFGDDENEICEYGNIDDSDLNCTDGFSGSAPVGSFLPNAWGLYDMHGNVWEWAYDWYDSSFFSQPHPKSKNPAQHNITSYRVLRGGSFRNTHTFARSAERYWNSPVDWYFGFRCVLSHIDGSPTALLAM